MELMTGYRRALLLDSVMSGGCAPGTVLEFAPSDFGRVIAPSPHYAGLPEILALARQLELPFPGEIRILALEVEEPRIFREGLSPAVAQALPAFVDRARQVLEGWRDSWT